MHASYTNYMTGKHSPLACHRSINASPSIPCVVFLLIDTRAAFTLTGIANRVNRCTRRTKV